MKLDSYSLICDSFFFCAVGSGEYKEFHLQLNDIYTHYYREMKEEKPKKKCTAIRVNSGTLHSCIEVLI